jgi:hypothetical protein
VPGPSQEDRPSSRPSTQCPIASFSWCPKFIWKNSFAPADDQKIHQRGNAHKTIYTESLTALAKADGEDRIVKEVSGDISHPRW